jgi:ubiquinone/menaquinone biosynthesis C-methylase UbiE
LSRSRIFERHYQWVAEDVARYCQRGRVLDVGTGPGWLLLALRQTLPDVEPVGVDISAGMVTQAARNLAQAGGSRAVEVRQAAADALPFPDDSFAAVVSTGSLHHWKNPVAGLNEIHRVLQPGGCGLMYDLVSQLPPEVRARARAEFGLVRATLFWLHSFEEPFYSPADLLALARATRFERGETRFVGVLCCLVLRKGRNSSVTLRS